MHITGRTLIFAAAVTLLGIVGVWSAPPLQGLWRLAAGLGVAGLGYEWLLCRWRAVRVQAELPARVYLGRAATLRFAFAAGDRPQALRYLPTPPAGIFAPAQVREVSLEEGRATDAVRIHPRALGRLTWPPQPVRLLGPLGLAWWSRTAPLDLETAVVPDTLGVGRAGSGTSAGGAARRAAIGAGHEIYQLRAYRPGDPPHAIDWKATARAARLITREFSEDQHLEIVVAVDAGRTSGLRVDELTRLGHYVNVAARFAEQAAGLDDRVGLIVFADRPLAALPPGRGITAVTRIREILASVQPQAAESNPISAIQTLRRLVHHRSLVVVLTEVDDGAAASQLAQAVRLLVPQHAPLIAGVVSDEIHEIANRRARDWLDPYVSLAALEHAASIRGNLRRLRRLGAHAVAARPAGLDAAVLESYRELRARRRI